MDRVVKEKQADTGLGDALVEDTGCGWKRPETLGQQWPGLLISSPTGGLAGWLARLAQAGCRHGSKGVSLAEQAAIVPATEARHGWL
jgi:hypothetical protein